MKLHYFFGCILAAASLAVWPEIGLAHGAEVVGEEAAEAHTSRVEARTSLGLISLPGRAIVFIAISTDPLDYGSYYDLPTDGTVYQGQVAPQDAKNVPYATPTSDPDIVISPYEPHAIISVAGIPQGAKVQDPVSNLIWDPSRGDALASFRFVQPRPDRHR